MTLTVHTDDDTLTAVFFKGAYGGWALESGNSDGMMWTLDITTNPGTYEWGAEDQDANWLGTHCEDVAGTTSDDGSNCEFTVAADGTITGQTMLHYMTSSMG